LGRDVNSNHRPEVLVCSPVRLYREGLADALSHAEDITVTGTAADAESCLGAVAGGTRIVLLDVTWDGGLTCLRRLTKAYPLVRVAALGAPEEEAEVMALAEAGVAAFLTRDEGIADLVRAIRGVCRGEANCSPRMAAILLKGAAARVRPQPHPAVSSGLTPRERQILEMIATGHSNKRIALELHIAVPTVKNHVHNIFEKLSVRGRVEAVAALRGA
jgi:two-component system, NarL family, nitrate/nitrite response regulator NarL